MKISTSFIAALVSVAVVGCAGSSVHSGPARVDRLARAQELGDLWVSPPKGRRREQMHLVYRPEAGTDLWNRKGFELSENPSVRLTPRLEAVLSRLTPNSTSTFVETSQSKRPW